jgi:RimJ/RimL family protein N-acetyltransferase
VRTIASSRLLLRPWAVDDAEFLLDLESRWEVVRFLGADPTTLSTHDDALASIERRRAIDDPVHGIWVITSAVDGRRVGNLLLKPIPLSTGEPGDGPTDVEIGWHLHPDAWGRGYATEAAEAVLEDAFSRGLAKVLAVTHPDNHASQAVCRRLGMTHVGRTTRYYNASNELFERRAGRSARTARTARTATECR